MKESIPADMLPERLRMAVSLGLTSLAAMLYAVILGSAIVRTYLEPNPEFPEAMMRAASLLSGLVGSVVTAGFAQGRRPASVPITTEHLLGPGRARTAWSSLQPPSLARCKFLGLATFIGARMGHPSPWATTGDEAPELEPGQPWSAALWVALFYFAVYFVIGAAAFVVTLMRPGTPEFLQNSAWVWLGTLGSSAYSFFGLNTQIHTTTRFETTVPGER